MSTPVRSTRSAASVWWGLGEVPQDVGPSGATLGVFDCVHRGHARLIDRTVQLGRSRDPRTVLITVDPHPALGPAACRPASSESWPRTVP